ncbi:hypothetical protein EDB81DRAFT_167481 [Dactylonectria macrodidyma]|uniref:Uncharacterized protein n=1 Tax=Dactylonectria macrodidyma TaxID=307937 RepID=A0A9P9JGQ4_9HYPO|nr:hypothetical protein EDB81DRAFT_167481 [Dactylonectria macrodidyma]
MSMENLATLALTQQHQPQTPPGSTSGSPKFKMESLFSGSFQECAPLPGLLHLSSPRSSPQITLPSLGEFDQGVEALARTHGPANCWSPPSPLPSLTRNSSILQPITPTQPSWPLRDHSFEDPAGDYLASRRGTITSLSQYALAGDQTWQPFPSYLGQDSYYGYSLSSPSFQDMDCYPSPPPEGENRHINQKYTTEEGDFIIYAWHDKKMKWQQIKQEFATRFGRTPERTVQGLQAWYYRMNQRIPIWDQEGWLCFDNEDELEPRHVGIKCRERDGQDKPMEPLGLAQRYPERAVNYSWVDPELKHKARDWAAKRAMQYRERRDRRRRKEQRRMKL